MAVCVSCGLPLYGDADFCPHHECGYADWAVANRIMCDFVHRQRVPLRPPEDEDFWTWHTRQQRDDPSRWR